MQQILERSQGRKSNSSLLKFQALNQTNCKQIVSCAVQDFCSLMCGEKSIFKRLKEIEDKEKMYFKRQVGEERKKSEQYFWHFNFSVTQKPSEREALEKTTEIKIFCTKIEDCTLNQIQTSIYFVTCISSLNTTLSLSCQSLSQPSFNEVQPSSVHLMLKINPGEHKHLA